MVKLVSSSLETQKECSNFCRNFRFSATDKKVFYTHLSILKNGTEELWVQRNEPPLNENWKEIVEPIRFSYSTSRPYCLNLSFSFSKGGGRRSKCFDC